MTDNIVKFLLLFAAGILGLLFKVFFDWMKKRGEPVTEKVRPECAFDREQTIFQVAEIHTTVDKCETDLQAITIKLDHGVAVAERNTESYSKFIIVLNDLKNMIKNSTEAQKEMTIEVRKQTVILTAIKKNGSGT